MITTRRAVFATVIAFGLTLFIAGSKNTEGQETTPTSRPSAAYPFESKFVEVDGHRIHYVEEGHGKPILFIHGNPTWSYIWRNIFPGVARATGRRAIAMDLLGFGKSDKPNIEYSLNLQAKIVRKFIKKLDLRDVILVGHDWGGPMMTNYAVRHPKNVDGLVLIETFAWKLSFADFGPVAPIFELLRSPEGFHVIHELDTWFVENLIKIGVINQENFTDEVFARYLEPFPTSESRTAILQFPRLIPIDGVPKASDDFFDEIERGLPRLDFPILAIRADPGVLISSFTEHRFAAFQQRLPRPVTIKDFGPGLHDIQEDDPEKIVRLMTEWIQENGLGGTGEGDDD